MRLINLNEIFEIKNGVPSNKVEFVNQDFKDKVEYKRPSYKFDSTFAGFINKEGIPKNKIFPEDTLYVSTDGDGSHSYSYVSINEFVPNSNVAVLIPKVELTKSEKIFYAKAITKNRYKFSYGRKPKGDRLAFIMLPHFEDLPDWINTPDNMSLKEKSLSKIIFIEDHSLDNIPSRICNNNLMSEDIIRRLGSTGSIKVDNKYIIFRDKEERKLICYQEQSSLDIKEQILISKDYLGKLNFDSRDWAYFEYQDIFELKKSGIKQGQKTVLHISATEKNNGLSDMIETDKYFTGNRISVSSNGSIGESFYQERDFSASGDINVLSNNRVNKYSAMFINTLIRKEKYRYSYGRKWGMEKMKNSKIKLPVDQNGEPDWKFMEDYIKTLPFSSAI
ncbi:restriction endonuclease subunit S [bacterium]|nr:restriction endonuclease subunit S [bacterium]MBU1959502.1 restriction endonuclease subunit S [bacterium]